MACLRLLTVCDSMRSEATGTPCLSSRLQHWVSGWVLLEIPFLTFQIWSNATPSRPLPPHPMTPVVDSSHLALASVRTPLGAEGDTAQHPHPQSASLPTLQVTPGLPATTSP